jgi:hypothetical protein
MPKMDGTGPEGKGSKTGRRLGFCEPLPTIDQLKLLERDWVKKRHSGGVKEKENV